METQETAPAAPPTQASGLPSPLTAAANDEVVRLAEAAVLHARTATAASEAKTADQVARAADQAAENAALKAAIEDLKAKFETVDKMSRRDRDTARLDALRKMGLESPLSDAQILALTPDVDPRDVGAIASLEAWRQANQRLFRVSAPTPESIVEAARVDMADLDQKTGGLFSSEKLIKSLLGGGS